MADHVEQLVGVLFRVLSEGEHTEAQQALLETYHSQATTDRKELTEDLFSKLITVLHEQIDEKTEVDVLITAIERLLTRFTAVVEAAPVAVLVVDRNDEIQVWNDGAERMFGWSDTEVRRQPYPQLLTNSPDTTDELLTRLRTGGRVHGIEAEHTDKNGAVLDVRIWAAPIQAQNEAFDGAVFIISDITEQKQREQRLAVLNRVLRHNIRNDVNVISAHLGMLAEECPDNDDHVRIINERLSNILDLSETARNIEHLRTDDEELTTLDIGQLLCDRVERFRAETRTARISADLPDSLPVAAHELLPYAFDNILDNALEHNDSETPRVRVGTDTESARNRVTVRVADNGPGLPPAERNVLTAQTETQLSHSNGLGLWLTRWIVRSSGGSITVQDSELGGTCVSVRLQVDDG